jgi:hypothetical protein
MVPVLTVTDPVDALTANGLVADMEATPAKADAKVDFLTLWVVPALTSTTARTSSSARFISDNSERAVIFLLVAK